MSHPQFKPDDNPAKVRGRQLFTFLKAFSEKRLPLRRTLAEQDWSLRLAELPKHDCVTIGWFTLPDIQAAEATEDSEALLEVKRPKLTTAPPPPDSLLDWLEEGWKDPDRGIHIRRSRAVRNLDGLPEDVAFDSDLDRTSALAQWQVRWDAWAEVERPARSAMRVFERMYELHGRMERESEGVELMLGDGRLRWRREDGLVDHPVLLQKVELQFDPDVPAFRIHDADRAPELHSVLLNQGSTISAESFNALRTELEKGGFHPLAVNGTQGYLRGLAQRLAARGEYYEAATTRPVVDTPRVEHDVSLFLRKRPSGFPAAFAKVLQDLEDTGTLPPALTRLIGIETPPPEDALVVDGSPWGEPPDLLLSKPANAEQIAVARTLARHSSVQVQGPPGTGKTHTIANLIGNLVAQGKRVLVTSHTTKALSVVREKIVEPLRPLCVSVLTSDLEARHQMEEAVKGIISRLSTADEAQLEANASTLERQRAKLNKELAEITNDLITAREAEYQPIYVGGEQADPSEATRWVTGHQEELGWIPGPIELGAPMPLSPEELSDLYLSSGQISHDEELELDDGVPEVDAILTPREFEIAVGTLGARESPDSRELWARPPTKSELDAVTDLRRVSCKCTDDLSRLESWQRRIVADGHTDGADARGWQALHGLVEEACQAYEVARAASLASDPIVPTGIATNELLTLCRQLAAHVGERKGLGPLTLLFHSDWKWFISNSSVNGQRPSSGADFADLMAVIELRRSLERLSKQWERLAVPAGLPEFATLPESPTVAKGYTDQFATLLSWWTDHWTQLLRVAEQAGFDWRRLRSRVQATNQPMLPFELDCQLLTCALPPIVEEYASLCERDRALHRLDALDKELDRGPVSMALREAAEEGNAVLYATRYEALLALIAKKPLHSRRQTWLAKLKRAAPAWERAVRSRQPLHGETTLPSDSQLAWKWSQLAQELDRRASLDEAALMSKLERRREALRDTTAKLIDSRAWLGQLRRKTLKTQQALSGWLATQKAIGKGTGKRAPKLKALARRQLAEARDAVPVWIMPLNRVAESFDPTGPKFDVVIIDEASQSDATGLLAWYLGDQVAVVGDNEQVSPLDVGTRIEDIEDLINQHLFDVPNRELYDGKTSIYDLAGMCFGGTIRLREHFRCVPEIIEFSNSLAYSGEIRPLRDGSRVALPHVTEVSANGISGGGRDGKENVAEARLLSAILAAMVEHPSYAGKSIGAITLLGDEQAITIQATAISLIGAVELEHRRFIAGNAPQFQGDERDVMLLSMVDSPGDGPLYLSQRPSTKQRYNVAASRAKDQMWLVHSLDPDRDLKEGDLRRRLIEHVRDPLARLREIERVQARAESPLESAVIEQLVNRGFRVEPQVWVGGYRMDLVVGEPGRQVAVECDGDRFHGPEEIPKDMARQAILERCGWRFVRIRGTKFFRDPAKAMEVACVQLAKLGVEPTARTTEASRQVVELREAIVRRAWEIMREQEWLPLVE